MKEPKLCLYGIGIYKYNILYRKELVVFKALGKTHGEY